MSFLYFLEDIRNPVLDTIFSLGTHLGEEAVFIALSVIIFWCVDKRLGYYFLSVGFIGTTINQFLKTVFRVPRPWVRDPSFTIIESARAEATGFSFPSGHTQAGVGAFGALARWYKSVPVRIICVLLCLFVPMSRMYLGVHTPIDVAVSVVIALILVFAVYPIFAKLFENKRTVRIFLASAVVLSVGLIAFLSLYRFPEDVDMKNITDALENGYKMLGCTLGTLISFEADERSIRFDPSGTLPHQILKVVSGMIPLFLMKSLLKDPLFALFGGHAAADGVRYLMMMLFIGCIWPLTFKGFAKIFKKKGDKTP